MNLKETLEKNNWNENGSTFHVFNSQEELNLYLERTSENPNWREEYGKFDFEQCIFNFEIKYWKYNFNDIVSFKNSTFNEDVSFKGCTFKRNADFDGCRFKKKVDFTKVKFEEQFYSPNYYGGNVNYSFCKFSNEVIFIGSFFNNQAWFNRAIFYGGADFSNSVFKKEFIIHNAEIFKNITFENTDFIGKINGWDLVCHSEIDFLWANFRSKINLSEITAKKLNFHGANFEKNAYLYNSKLGHLDLTQSVIDKGLYFLNSSIKSANRETWRIIKHEFIKQNNKIESLNYYSLEMRDYEKEIFNKKKTHSLSLLNFFIEFYLIFKGENKTDKFILFFNRISNSYNTSPFRGVAFTLSTTIIFYLLIIYSIKLENALFFDYSFKYLGLNIKQMFQLLNITNWNYTPFNQNFNYSYIILFLSRIFISFGIYQTIQAFRKYGKA